MNASDVAELEVETFDNVNVEVPGLGDFFPKWAPIDVNGVTWGPCGPRVLCFITPVRKFHGGF